MIVFINYFKYYVHNFKNHKITVTDIYKGYGVVAMVLELLSARWNASDCTKRL